MNLNNLTSLFLDYNNLITIDKYSFVGLVSLLSVNLGNNPISLKQPSYVKVLAKLFNIADFWGTKTTQDTRSTPKKFVPRKNKKMCPVAT